MNDKDINDKLNEYFTALAAAADAADYAFLLEIADSYVPAPTATGAYPYQVTGTFGGYVDISLGGNPVTKVWFGAGEATEVDGSVEKVNVFSLLHSQAIPHFEEVAYSHQYHLGHLRVWCCHSCCGDGLYPFGVQRV